MEPLTDVARTALGLGQEAGDIGIGQMALRAVLVYIATLLLVRLGSKRFLSESTAFDIIVAIIIGSVMSRAINGSAPLLPTVAATVVLLALHWLLSLIAFSTDWFGDLVKGKRVLLIENGVVQEQGMRRGHITRNDLIQALHLQMHDSDPAKVERAYLERNGQISVVPVRERAGPE